MPNTRKSEIRYKVLDRCLKRGGYSTQMLMDAVNAELLSRNEEPITSMNTIRNDLVNMEAAYPDQIRIVPHKGGDARYITYSYEDPSMSINKIPFKDEELAQLIQCMELLKRFRGVPNMNWLSDFIDRFQLSLDVEVDGVVGFDVCDQLMGRQWFGRILTAITSKRVLKIKYRRFGASENWTMFIHPYYLKEHAGRWFLLGLNNMYLSITTLALDRMMDVSITDGIPFIENEEIDFEHAYFKDIVGVTRKSKNPRRVRLWVHPELAPYIITKPLHHSQQVRQNNADGMIVTLNVIPNYELEQLILCHGEKIKVIAPHSLADRIAMRLRQAVGNYPESDEEFNEDY